MYFWERNHFSWRSHFWERNHFSGRSHFWGRNYISSRCSCINQCGVGHHTVPRTAWQPVIGTAITTIDRAANTSSQAGRLGIHLVTGDTRTTLQRNHTHDTNGCTSGTEQHRCCQIVQLAPYATTSKHGLYRAVHLHLQIVQLLYTSNHRLYSAVQWQSYLE